MKRPCRRCPLHCNGPGVDRPLDARQYYAEVHNKSVKVRDILVSSQKDISVLKKTCLLIPIHRQRSSNNLSKASLLTIIMMMRLLLNTVVMLTQDSKLLDLVHILN